MRGVGRIAGFRKIQQVIDLSKQTLVLICAAIRREPRKDIPLGVRVASKPRCNFSGQAPNGSNP